MNRFDHSIRRRRRLRRAITLAVFTGVAGAGVAIAEQVTVRQSVDVLEDKTAASDVVETVNKSAQLEVLGHEGKWIHVKTASGKDGYVSEAVLKANTGGGLDLSGLTGGPNASEMSTAAAGKGFDDSVESYARDKNFSKDGLNKMIRFRKGVTGAEWKQFARSGNVGPNHQ